MVPHSYLETTLERRKALMKLIKDIYSKRCELVHGRLSDVDKESTMIIQNIISDILYILLKNYASFEHRDIPEWIHDLKLGIKLPIVTSRDIA